MRTRLNPIWVAFEQQTSGGPSVPSPYFFPYQFYVGGYLTSAYGGTGNGKLVTDGAITSGSHTFTSASITPASAGQAILVSGAGGGTYLPLATTIASAGSGTCTLTAAATSTVTSAITYYGTDDTAAVTSALAAAVAYAQANNGYAEVIFDPLMYIIAGAPVIGGATLGNAQIPLPILPATAQKVTVVFRGVLDATPVAHWLQTTPQASGTVLACARTDGQNLPATNGPAAVIGGPFNGYGGDNGLFSNMMPVIDGITVLLPYNSTYCGFDFFGMAEADVITASAICAGVVPVTGPVPTLSSAANITNQYTFGLRMPCTGNNDNCNVGWFTCEGLCYGFMPSEHTDAVSVRSLYNIIGIEGYSGNNATMPHSGRIHYASIESCTQGVGFFDGQVNLDIDTLDAENVTNVIFDPSNHGIGYFGLRGSATAIGYLTGIVSGGAGIRVVNLQQAAGPVASPQAPPASGSPWLNAYYRDAEITLSISGGTLSALNTDSVAESLPASCTLYKFTVPAGHSYTPTFGGTLTHKVKLT